MTRIQRQTETRPARLRRVLCAALLAIALPCLAQAEPAARPAHPGGDVASVPAANRATAASQARKKPAGEAQSRNRSPQKRQAASTATARQAAQAPQRRIQCVQYVVANSEFRVRGNARDWWHNARDVHARGNTPEPGSVLSFRSVKSMPLGHVAIVSRVVSSREILIDHANWTRGAISRSHSVIDVSPRNDWTAVRVAVKPGADVTTHGKVYPTDGFIYARRRDEAVNVADRSFEQAPPQVIQPPRDLRPTPSPG